MKLYRSAHAVYKTQYHIVFVTKYRKAILVNGVDKYLRLKLEEVRKYYPEWFYEEIGMDSDHVHLCMVIPPKYAVSFVIETIKKNTARAMREKFVFIQEAYERTQSIWSTGYFVSTVGIDENTIRKYVRMQGEEDTGQAQLDFWRWYSKQLILS